MNFKSLPARFLGEEMSARLPRLLLLACVVCPSWSWALGLGEIHLNSALNEPLKAEIDLIAASPDELAALRASLASRDAFTRYGIERPAFLNSLTFKVGKGKDGRDVLLVRSSETIPEPFVTFLVEVNWARGRLMREYTVLLDPPVYTPGESAGSAAPIAGPTAAPMPKPSKPAPVSAPSPAPSPAPAPPVAPAPSESRTASLPGTYKVVKGDTLSKIAQSLRGPRPAQVDQTMIALFNANPAAFDNNINILHRGAILRVPGADEIAALNQKDAISEVARQMSTWRGNGGATAASGHLRLVTPKAGANGGGAADTGAAAAETAALKNRIKDLETQLAESHRLVDVRSSELSELQRKLATLNAAAAPTAASKTPAPTPPAHAPTPPPVVANTPPAAIPPAATPPAATPPAAATPPPAAATPPAATPPADVPPPVVAKPAAPKPMTPPPAAASDSGSWLDWVTDYWYVPAGVIAALLAGIGFVAFRRRRSSQVGEFASMTSTDVSEDDATTRFRNAARGEDSFVVEESGEHKAPDFSGTPEAAEPKASDDTMSSESAVNIDQGDPLAEADFHMAYGLYDQAADLVRIALEREPDRRDLRLKLLEIYFVWGNKDAFLQTAKALESTRDRAPAGEWDKIVIMGKQICPEDPLFSKAVGGGRGAGALVDLNLEGGENRVDIDLFGEPEGEHSRLDGASVAKDSDATAQTGESPHLPNDGLDFMLDAPERGADESPTREMPPRDEPTVESELMHFAESPTAESPSLGATAIREKIASKMANNAADQTAEVSIDDLGLDLDGLADTASPHTETSRLEETDHPSDAPTMVAGLDERSRRLMAEAESKARDRDLTELERELEASFISELDASHEEIKTAVISPDAAPTVHMPRDTDMGATSKLKSVDKSSADPDRSDIDSTSKLRGINVDSIDLDLDRLASALGGGADTVQQPRAAEELFSSEVFEASQRNRRVDLDVGEALNGSEGHAATTQAQKVTAKMTAVTEGPLPEFEPVTMSEVGTKLDLARAYMDMGDPEGARSILDEVVHEGSASQKQEAQRLIQSLPG
jgi:pilus assembly protein FimV